MVKKKKDDDGLDSVFSKKHKKHLPTGFEETAEALSLEELERLIIDAEKTIEEVELDLESDERLKALKEECKDILGGFGDLKKACTAKIKYCLHVLKSRGNA